MTLNQDEMDYKFAEVQLMRVRLGTATPEQIKWLQGYLQKALDKIGHTLTHGTSADCPDVQSGKTSRCMGHRA